MIRNPTVIYLPDAQEFIDGLEKAERKKVIYNIDKTKEGLKGEWFKRMPGTDDLWEFRTLYNNKKIRLLCFWDTTDKNNPLIVTTNGFIKKKKKTPLNEIEKAERIKSDYFNKL